MCLLFRLLLLLLLVMLYFEMLFNLKLVLKCEHVDDWNSNISCQVWMWSIWKIFYFSYKNFLNLIDKLQCFTQFCRKIRFNNVILSMFLCKILFSFNNIYMLSSLLLSNYLLFHPEMMSIRKKIILSFKNKFLKLT